MPLQSVMNGRPVRPDAERLVERFRSMMDGIVLSHETIEAITRTKRTDGRYYQIVGAARRYYRDETGIQIETVRGCGMRKPTGDEQIRMGLGDIRKGSRCIKRGSGKIAMVPDNRLGTQGRAARDHFVQRTKYLEQVMRTEQTAMQQLVKPPETNPRIAPE